MGKLGGEEPAYSGSGDPLVPARLVRVVEVPRIEKVLEDASMQPLSHLASGDGEDLRARLLRWEDRDLLSARDARRHGKYADLSQPGLRRTGARRRPTRARFPERLPASWSIRRGAG